jgi:hypothetical protein
MTLKNKKLFSFILYHLSLTLIFYYFAFLVLDLVTRGLPSSLFSGGFLIIALLITGTALSFLNLRILSAGNIKKKRARLSLKTLTALAAFSALILFLALFPHDWLSALVIASAFFSLILINQKKLRFLNHAHDRSG